MCIADMGEKELKNSPLEWPAMGASPWPVLRNGAQAVVDLLEKLRTPLLAVGADGEIVSVRVWPSRRNLRAHSRWPGMPHLAPEEVLVELLDRLERHYRDAQLVELFAQWPDPAGVHRELVASALRASISGSAKTALEA